MASPAVKTGVDDYLAGGGSIAELLLMAQPFKSRDLARERLNKDEPLRLALEERRRYLREMPVKTTGQNTRTAVIRALTAEAEQSGKLVEDGDAVGVRVVMDRRTLAERAGKSKKAVNKAIAILEDEPGALRVDNAGRRAEKPGAFVLPIAQKGTHSGSKECPEKREGQEAEGFSPLSKASFDRGGYPSALTEDVPALRWSKVILYWEREKGVYKVVDHHYVARLGDKRGNIIRHVLEAGGESSDEELIGRFAGPKTRPWDFRRRVLGPIVEAKVFEKTSTGVLLAPGWREALERDRNEKEELEDAERQRERHTRQRKAFHDSRKLGVGADPTPELPGKEKVRHIFRDMEQRDEAARLEEQRSKAGTTVEVFINDTLADLGKVRMGLLRELWADKGGDPSHVWFGVRRLGCKVERLPEHDNELFVLPREGRGAAPERENLTKPDLAAVVPIRPEPSVEPSRRREESTPDRGLPKQANGVFAHGPECLCDWCDDAPEPSYARPVGGG